MADSTTNKTGNVSSNDDVKRVTDFEGTQEAAKQASPDTAKDAGENPEIKKGADKDFNAWMRKAHEAGNPEQLSPMQAEQNIQDKVVNSNEPENRIDDLNDEDTRWVVENVKGEKLPENSK